MAKEIAGYVNLQIKGGQANPAPPVGPALGQRGINIMEFCKAFNEKTKAFMGKPVPVVITVYKDKKFDFIIKSPLLFVALPNVVPASLKKISSPSASSTISAGVSNVIAPDEVPTVTDASPVDRLSEAKLASV